MTSFYQFKQIVSDSAILFKAPAFICNHHFEVLVQFPHHFRLPPKIIRQSIEKCLEDSKQTPWRVQLFSNINYQYFFVYPLLENKEDWIYICVGPVVMDEVSHNQVRKVLIQNNLDAAYEETLVKYYKQLPVYTLNQLRAMERVLPEIVSQRSVLSSGREFIETRAFKENLEPVRDQAHSYETEKEFMKLFKEGDPRAVDQFSRVKYETSIVNSDPLRSEKNRMVVLNAELTRSCMEAGVERLEVLSLSDFYTNYIEMQSTINNMKDLGTYMVKSYLERIQELHKIRIKSPIVERAKRYIYKNLTEPISLKVIASELQVHPNYLSSVFAQEMGDSISQFINMERIKEAKELLSISHYTVLEISILLGYNSQSYFTRVFKKEVGMGPVEFRNYVQIHK